MYYVNQNKCQCTNSMLISPLFLCLRRNRKPKICMTFVQCWTNVEDVGPTLYKCYANVLCLLERL